MGYAQWVTINLSNRSSQELNISNVVLSWGKFYADGDKDHEIPASDIADKVIPVGGGLAVSACGRDNLPSGTEGSFDVVERSTGRLVRSVMWNCPFFGSNSFELAGFNESWVVGHSPISSEGALGEVTASAAGLDKSSTSGLRNPAPRKTICERRASTGVKIYIQVQVTERDDY